jgi:hypothetical protein
MMRKFSGSHRDGRDAFMLRAMLAGAAFILILTSSAGASEFRLSLTGKVTTTEVSGIAGTPVVLGMPEGTQGIYGIRSLERDDKPCYVAAVTEEVNNYGKDSGFGKNLCGKNPGGAEMQAKFGDIKFARRTFVRAVRVCMTKDDSKIKGFQLRGRQFGPSGNVIDLPPRYAEQPSSPVLEDLLDLNAPSDMRLHCDAWKEWVECPPGEIATALAAHFNSGPPPNSLTGIALQCRAIGRER